MTRGLAASARPNHPPRAYPRRASPPRPSQLKGSAIITRSRWMQERTNGNITARWRTGGAIRGSGAPRQAVELPCAAAVPVIKPVSQTFPNRPLAMPPLPWPSPQKPALCMACWADVSTDANNLLSMDSGSCSLSRRTGPPGRAESKAGLLRAMSGR